MPRLGRRTWIRRAAAAADAVEGDQHEHIVTQVLDPLDANRHGLPRVPPGLPELATHRGGSRSDRDRRSREDPRGEPEAVLGSGAPSSAAPSRLESTRCPAPWLRLWRCSPAPSSPSASPPAAMTTRTATR